jgi:hypothetical protein
MKMKILYLLFVLFFSAAAICNGGTLENEFASSRYAGNDSSFQRKFFLGMNVTHALAGDVELYAMYQFGARHSMTICAGYDFNALDFGTHLDEEDQLVQMESKEQETGEESRYFWGNGPAFRIGYDFRFPVRPPSGIFIAAAVMMKVRNYEHYSFGEIGGGLVHSESADQHIFGFSILGGYEYQHKMICLKPHIGAGVRLLQSKIYRPAIRSGNQVYYAETSYSEEHYYPALHLGFTILFKIR